MRRRSRLEAWTRPFTTTRPAEAPVPWVALSLAGVVLVTAIVTGTFLHPLSDAAGARGGFGWPALVVGRWWTVLTSFALSRDWFMAATMPLALVLAVAAYERRAGHVRALSVTAIGHLTGSVLVAIACGALGWTGQPILVRAAENLDYGGSMAVAAALGALASRLGSRRWSVAVFVAVVAAVPAHHQMADWGHLVALPTGFLVDRVRRPAWSRVAFAAVAVATAGLVAYGPVAVDATVRAVRFGTTKAGASDTGSSPVAQGHVESFTYDAPHLGGRPEVASVYLPADRGPAPRPVAVFLHGVPGAGTDWLVGGAVDDLLDARIATGASPAFLAVFPTADGFHDPAAGWRDAGAQRQLASIGRDLLPAIARRYRVDLRRSRVAVIGVGRGADGALALGRVDPAVGFEVAVHPHRTVTPVRPGGPARLIIGRPRTARPAAPVAASARWREWRADLPRVLDWLTRVGFGGRAARG